MSSEEPDKVFRLGVREYEWERSQDFSAEINKEIPESGAWGGQSLRW